MFGSKSWLPLALCVPAALILMKAWGGPWDDDLFYGLMHESGEMSVRLLVAALIATPLQRIWPKARGIKWLRRSRRALGVAAFGYGVLHVVLYLWHVGGGFIDDLALWTYRTGWLALLAMTPLAATSFDAAVRTLGIRRWRRLHRLAYVAVTASALHWVTKPEGDVWLPTLIHFAPLAVLEAWRFRLDARRPPRRPQS